MKRMPSSPHCGFLSEALIASRRKSWLQFERHCDIPEKRCSPASSRFVISAVRRERSASQTFHHAAKASAGFTSAANVDVDVKQRKESAIEPSQGLLAAFRVTERLARAIRREISAPKVTVLPNFEVHVESLFFPAATERRLRPLSDLAQRGIVTVFKLTKSKVAAELATNPEENPIEALKVLSGRELPANVEQIKQMAEELNIPILTGGTPQTTRDAIYAEFKAGRLRRLVVSKIANFSVDLPDAAVAIQISGTFGSRQEEAQRLGRVLRPKPGENQAR